MERLFLDPNPFLDNLPPVHAGAVSQSPILHPIDPVCAIQLRRNPQLKSIHLLRKDVALYNLELSATFDSIDPSESSSIIYSYRHEGSELLHTRSLKDRVDVADVPYVKPGIDLFGTSGQIRYHSRDDTQRLRIYVPLSIPRWEDATEFEGRIVPLEVLEEMRQVEGATMEEWLQRDVQVKPETWAVLTKWSAGMSK